MIHEHKSESDNDLSPYIVINQEGETSIAPIFYAKQGKIPKELFRAGIIPDTYYIEGGAKRDHFKCYQCNNPISYREPRFKSKRFNIDNEEYPIYLHYRCLKPYLEHVNKLLGSRTSV